ncbi:hypothetical protein CLD22_03100 [Rubrivivax gelatinosus]|nr:hypothetical protein [Rubrivivax gelatinosus]
MNELFVTLGIESWKPMLTTLVLPPVPMLLLILAGAALLRRRALGWLPLLLGVAGLWAVSTFACAYALVAWLTMPPPALTQQQVLALRGAPKTAIVVLGAGRYPLAPEYGTPALKPFSVERLRYGLWLARQTGLPLGFSGGLGHGAEDGPSEAEVAMSMAKSEYRQPLRWAEGRSRDTNENAIYTVAMLRRDGIERIVLVTHDFHMRRAQAAFERAISRDGLAIAVLPAPTGMRQPRPPTAGDLMPGGDGFRLSWLALHEWLGRLAGA